MLTNDHAGVSLPLVPGSLPLFDLSPMIGVVLRHHRWNVTERDRTDTILLPKAHPIPTIKRPKDCNIREPRISERRNALGERERLVIPLSGDPGAVEVGQPRIAFLPKPADSHGVSLAFQVRQVPAMLDGRERLIRPWHRCLEQRDRLEGGF